MPTGVRGIAFAQVSRMEIHHSHFWNDLRDCGNYPMKNNTHAPTLGTADVTSTLCIDLGHTTLTRLTSNIVELVVHENVAVDAAMIDSWVSTIPVLVEGDVGLLINKKYNYWYTWEAQQQLCSYDPITAPIAILPHAGRAEEALEFLRTLPPICHWNIRTIRDRGQALTWLQSELARNHFEKRIV